MDRGDLPHAAEHAGAVAPKPADAAQREED